MVGPPLRQPLAATRFGPRRVALWQVGVGLIIWILVQLAVMPETMVLQWIFLAVGLVLGFVALFWLRLTGRLRLW